MKKYFGIWTVLGGGVLLLAALAVFFIAYRGTAKPAGAVNGFLRAAQSFHLTKMQKFVASDDLGDLQTMMATADDPLMTGFRDYFKTNAAQISYSIRETQTTGDTATVTVACKYVDSTAFAQEVVKELLVGSIKDALSGKQVSKEDMAQRLSTIVAAKQKSAKTVFTTETIRIPCVKVHGRWYIATVDENLINVVMSNFFNATANLQHIMGGQ